jgi:hypothetical protein
MLASHTQNPEFHPQHRTKRRERRRNDQKATVYSKNRELASAWACAPFHSAHPRFLGQTNSWLSRYVWEACLLSSHYNFAQNYLIRIFQGHTFKSDVAALQNKQLWGPWGRRMGSVRKDRKN